MIQKMKSEQVKFVFLEIGDLNTAKLITYSDASLNNLKDGESHIIFIVGENQRYAPLVWSSKKIKRIVKSTIAAETLALLDAAEYCFLIQPMIKNF